MKRVKGLTVWICFGSYGGFHISISKIRTGITLGWVSFQILTMDCENLLYNLLKERDLTNKEK